MKNLNLIISIEKLLEDRKNSQRTLEEYLLAFWSLAIQYKNENPKWFIKNSLFFLSSVFSVSLWFIQK